MNGASRFASLRKDIDRMLSLFGLSQNDAHGTHLGDGNDTGGDHGPHAPHQPPLRELLDSDAEQRHEAAVPRLRPEGSDEPGGRRVLPLDAMPLVRLALGAEGDVAAPFVLRLRWTCQACGWERVVDAPGFAGDGHLHYPDGVHGCGPITAQRATGYPLPRDATPIREADRG